MSDCKFCALLANGRLAGRLPNLVLETEDAIVAVNRRPLSAGHITLIFKRHHDRTGALRDSDLTGLGGLAGRIASALEDRYRPKRVVFLGDGKPGAHLHFHLIPEFAGAPLDLGAVVNDLNLTPRPNTLNDADTVALVAALRSHLRHHPTPVRPASVESERRIPRE